MMRYRWACVFASLMMMGLIVLGHLHVTVMQCPIYKYTHWPCPGCGLTRSAEATVFGNIDAVWRLHLFGPLIIVLALMFIICSVLPDRKRLALSGTISAIEYRTAISGIVIVLIGVYWLVRLLGYFGGLDALYV